MAKANKEKVSNVVSKVSIKRNKKSEGKITFAGFINNLAKTLKSQNAAKQKELLDAIFPRTVDSLKPVGNTRDKGVGDMKLTYCFDSNEPLPTKQIFRSDLPEGILAMFSQSFIGWQACAQLYQSHWAMSRACDAPAEDAMAPGYHLSYSHKNKENEGDQEKLVDIAEKSRRDFHILDICERAEKKSRQFGGCIVVPCIEGVDFEKPFDINKVGKGTYKGMAVVEPYWIQPEFDDDAKENPSSLHFYEPTYYTVNGQKSQKYHRSWVRKYVHKEVGDILKPAYYWFGPSVIQLIYEVVYGASRVSNEAPLLAQTKRLVVVDADLMNYVANQKEADMALSNLTYLRDNFGVYVKNPGDDLIQIDTTLSDFPELIMTKWQEVASAAEMPAVKLLKTQPKGFNSTGEFEENDYKQLLLRIQKRSLNLIDFHNMLYTKSVYGEAIDLVPEFYPIDTPTEEQRAIIAEKLSLEIVHYTSSGIISQQEGRDILRNDPRGIYTFLPKDLPDDIGNIEEFFPYTEKDNKGRPMPKSEEDPI